MLKTLQECPPATGAGLPFHAIFHPMGYAVEISSNSPDVLGMAAKLWRRYPALSDAAPIRIRVLSNPARASALRQPLPPRIEGRLFSIVHGAQDFAIADLSTGLAVLWLSQTLIAEQAYFSYHFLEPLAYVMQGAQHFAFVHASCISRNGLAILLCGDSGSGKTCLAYACAKRGWDFVSGDAVQIVRGRNDRMVIGRPYEIRFRESARGLFPELIFRCAGIRANGKLDLELDTGELGILTALQSFARHIVFIERSNVDRIETCARTSAMRKLEETICYGDDRTRLEQRETLSHFSGLPVWRLYYSDPDRAERTLARLLDGELPC